MKYSAQAIIVDSGHNVYLERNKKIWSLSFVWGAIEWNETAKEALLREIKEELDLLLLSDDLCFPEEQIPTIFPTGAWISTYFILHIDEQIAKKIKANPNIEVYNVWGLEKLEDTELPIQRTRFFEQVERALWHIY